MSIQLPKPSPEEQKLRLDVHEIAKIVVIEMRIRKVQPYDYGKIFDAIEQEIDKRSKRVWK